MPNTFSTLYEKSSIKQLYKKLKYAKEEYYSTLLPEAKAQMNYIKLRIVINSGNSKYVYKDVVNTKEKKEIEAKREKERRKKEKKRKKREEKRERNRIKQEEQKRKFKEEIEELRRREVEEERKRRIKEQEEEWRRREAQEECRRRKIEEEREMERKLPQDILQFKKYPTKKVWRDLIKKYHPDKGGNEELMKIINSIWEESTGKY
tara:strand:- start:58 stop:675 length:618 start_codon:yes stop_codon:yes gene_type:complete